MKKQKATNGKYYISTIICTINWWSRNISKRDGTRQALYWHPIREFECLFFEYSWEISIINCQTKKIGTTCTRKVCSPVGIQTHQLEWKVYTVVWKLRRTNQRKKNNYRTYNNWIVFNLFLSKLWNNDKTRETSSSSEISKWTKMTL
jgi:hypothetical protein